MAYTGTLGGRSSRLGDLLLGLGIGPSGEDAVDPPTYLYLGGMGTTLTASIQQTRLELDNRAARLTLEDQRTTVTLDG